MKVAAIALDLRPRSMTEAGDLGVRLVGSCRRSVWRSVGPVYGVVLLLALSTIELGFWLPLVVLFWLKPWLDRSLLFVLARATFGQETRFADMWAARGDVWWRHLLPTLTTRRFSPWRSYVAPVQQLEGQPWRERRPRVKQVLRGRYGAAYAMQFAFSTLEQVFAVGVAGLTLWMAPVGKGSDWFDAAFLDGNLVNALMIALCYAVALAIVEPFFVGAGFTMYLNRRVELEAWDIEQEFRLAFAP